MIKKQLTNRTGIIIFVVVILILHSCMSTTDKNEISFSFDQLISAAADFENRDDYWSLSDPKTEDLNNEALKTHLELCIRTGADAVLVTKGNQIVCEWYSERYRTPQYAMSSTKSVTALIYGIMEDRGLIKREAFVSDYLKGWTGGYRDSVRIEQLLSMTSGLLRFPSSAHTGVGWSDAKNDYVQSLYPKIAPGTRWSYSNEGAQLLSPILESASGMNLNDFATENLFKPLGMEYSRLHESGSDNSVWTYADMHTSPRDLGRLARLVLNKGKWHDEQIISEEYIKQMLTPLKLTDNYGFLWWLYETEEYPIVAMKGYLDTNVYIIPDSELIIIRMQAPKTQYSGKQESGNYDELAMHLFPAFINPEYESRISEVQKDMPAAQDGYLQNKTDTVLQHTSDRTKELPPEVFSSEHTEFSNEAVRILDEAINLSTQGDTETVIKILIPYLEKEYGNREQRTQAKLSLCLAFVRINDQRTAKNIFKSITEEDTNSLSGWWIDNYTEFKELLQ